MSGNGLWLIESIEWLIEDQAFLRSYDSALIPSPLLPSFSVFLYMVAGRAYWRGWGGGGRGAKLYDREKAWPSLDHSILSGGLGSTLCSLELDQNWSLRLLSALFVSGQAGQEGDQGRFSRLCGNHFLSFCVSSSFYPSPPHNWFLVPSLFHFS
jgi:hypothetical protein